jgi:thiamine-phosphate pyrophosphorylase
MDAGADCVQLREKSLDSRTLLARAKRLVAIARGHASTIINDRADIALLAGADGVHVGQSDLSLLDVRKIAGFSLLVGVSTSSIAHARAAAHDGADYCGVGPMFASQTKPNPALAGAEYLRQYVSDPQVNRLPHLAIGGITPRNASDLRDAGCAGIAVSSCICGSPDPALACKELLHSLATPDPERRDT